MKSPLNPIFRAVLLTALASAPVAGFAQALYSVPDNVQSRWITFENPTGEKGAGGQAGNGRKGAACKTIGAGETVTLADLEGPGVIRRIWCTRSGGNQPELLRGMVFRIYWDDQTVPSVSAHAGLLRIPFGRRRPVRIGPLFKPGRALVQLLHSDAVSEAGAHRH